MAGRTRNRMDLRRQAELAEQRGPRPADTAPRRSSSRDQVRVCARWGVFDGAMKLIEAFDYKQRAEADKLAAELNAARKNGTTYFVQIVKEAMPVSGRVDLD